MSIKCKECGAILDDSMKFCTGCGAKLEKESNVRVCPHCGASIREGASFCVECGGQLNTPIDDADTVSPVSDGNCCDNSLKETMANLRETLAEFLQKQRENPSQVYCVSLDFEKMPADFMAEENESYKEDSAITAVVGGLSNGCFNPQNGEEMFLTTDNKPHLMLDFCIDEMLDDCADEFLNALVSSVTYERLSYIKVDFKNRKSCHHFYADFGDNVEEMTRLCQDLIMLLCGDNFPRICYFEVLTLDNKETVRKQAVKTAKYRVKKLGLTASKIR